MITKDDVAAGSGTSVPAGALTEGEKAALRQSVMASMPWLRRDKPIVSIGAHVAGTAIDLLNEARECGALPPLWLERYQRVVMGLALAISSQLMNEDVDTAPST